MHITFFVQFSFFENMVNVFRYNGALTFKKLHLRRPHDVVFQLGTTEICPSAVR